jgi:hypothetical protein
LEKKMKNFQIKIFVLSVLAMFMVFSNNAFAGSGSLSVSATVVASAAVTQNTALSFGSFALTDSGSPGTLDTNGADSNIDEMIAPTTGVVDISGAANETVNISVDASVTLSDGGLNSMTASLSVPAPTVLLDSNGAGTSNVNGVLTISSGQATGTYTGSATVTVNY